MPIDYEFPKTMWKSLRTTNTLENLNREFRRMDLNNDAAQHDLAEGDQPVKQREAWKRLSPSCCAAAV